MTRPTFRQAVPQDTARCFEIERAAYEGDEAATEERISKRIAVYPEGFVVMEVDGQIVGFVNSGCARRVVMSDESFKDLVGHEPDAPNVVIMSVVVDPAHQGRGHSTLLLREFVARMRQAGKAAIHLMCKSRHVELYAKHGFRYVRLSDSTHGGMTWHEMILELSKH